MANLTPEPANQLAVTIPAPSCGYCESTHLAHVTCKCLAPCSVGYCPRTADGEVGNGLHA